MRRRTWVVGIAGGLALAIVFVSVAWFRGVAAAPAVEREVQAGRALYATHCAVCHGERGEGDGASAAAFATKPANLTDGRVINPLPDDFLVNVIKHGGPAEGLAPTMPPFGRTLTDDQIRHVVRFVRTLARPAFDPSRAAAVVTPPHAPRQPIFFSHLVHAGSFQIACQYCHADARRSEYAGLPSVDRCLGCHRIIGAQDNPEIQKILEYGRRGEPIPWVRVFKVPEFTYFPHKAHVRAEVACQTCHGPIERMRVVGAATGPDLVNDLLNLAGVRARPPVLSMGWCVDCHRSSNARGAAAPLDCIACHH